MFFSLNTKAITHRALLIVFFTATVANGAERYNNQLAAYHQDEKHWAYIDQTPVTPLDDEHLYSIILFKYNRQIRAMPILKRVISMKWSKKDDYTLKIILENNHKMTIKLFDKIK